MHRYFLFLLYLLTCSASGGAGSNASTDSLLIQLETAISNRPEYAAAKEARINELQARLQASESDDERFYLLGDLYDEYHSFNTDSAYALSLRREMTARKLRNNDMLINARLNKANIFCNTGMYLETLTLLDSIDQAEIPAYLKAYYFHIRRTAYGNIADCATFMPEKQHYAKLTDQYRDSLLAANDPESFVHALIKADQLNVHGHPKESIDLLNRYADTHNLPEHDKAVFAWSMAESYGMLRDVANQKKYLLISAISDMKSATREYASLRNLALLLYQEGDLDRAYRFLTIATEDAAKCNARHRIIELNDLFLTVNGIYVDTVNAKKQALERTIIIIAILSAILILMLVLMRKQMIRIARARKELEASNDKLNDLNLQLTQSNKELHIANNALSDISELKEVYICRYMEQSLAHIEMLDNYRKNVGKLLSSGKISSLEKFVKSSSIVDNELKSFYEQFDRTFLSLFPNFVDDFNSLLMPGEAIIPKKDGHLNTELRIYALIRLGITDSDRIAKFLRYSLSTVYNYRTKVRNKAIGDRNLLEEKVVRIAQQSSSR